MGDRTSDTRRVRGTGMRTRRHPGEGRMDKLVRAMGDRRRARVRTRAIRAREVRQRLNPCMGGPVLHTCRVLARPW